MISRRTLINLGVFFGLFGLLIYFALSTLVLQKSGGRTLTLEFTDVSGINERNDVTMRGVPVGAVSSIAIGQDGLARVRIQLEPGNLVPEGTKAEITRRSPIGDITIELTPGNGPPLPNGATIDVSDTLPPPDPELTIEALRNVLHAVPSQDLGTLINQLAVAVNGRGEDLATLSEVSADLPERILQVKSQLESLIRNGPKVTGVLANNADTLANDLDETAALADILRDRRYDLVNLTVNGANFADVANELISGEKANLACLIKDFGNVNATLAEPQHLNDLKGTLDLNHFFFDAVEQLVQPGKDGLDWFRVQLLPPQQPSGRNYTPKRPPPGIYPGLACQSQYGSGVGPVTQPGGYYVAPGSQVHGGG